MVRAARRCKGRRWRDTVGFVFVGEDVNAEGCESSPTGSGSGKDLEFGEDEADAAYDVVGGGLVGGEGKKLHGKVAGVGTEDKTAFVEVDEAEQERGAAADSVERGLVRAIRREGVVVTVEDGDGSWCEERVHGGGLLCVGTDGEEALPVRIFGGRASAVVVEARGGDVDGFDDG